MESSISILTKKVKPGDLLAEFDLVEKRFLGKYIVISMDNYEFDAYCLYDITGYFPQGEIVSIGHDEIVDTNRYVWSVEPAMEG
tara:strand:+ start:44906 stop:45157 length:252 start_codon:yes stop_codon:yes gene_type:complete